MTGLSPDDRLRPGLRIWSAFVAVLIPPLLWIVSFETLASILSAGRPSLPTWSRGFSDARLAEWLDELFHRFRGPWKHTCLKRSATLFFLLRSAGRPVEMCIGVRRDEQSRLQAHAWLLLGDAIYLEPDPTVPDAHNVIARFPDSG